MNVFFLILFVAHLDDCPEELLSDRYLKFDEVHLISAKDQIAIDDVKQSIRRTLDKHAEHTLNENSTKPPNNLDLVSK